jgi:hypothetical protein
MFESPLFFNSMRVCQAPIQLSTDCVSLLSRLLAPDPSQRLSVQEALSHPFFRSATAGGGGRVGETGKERDELDEYLSAELRGILVRRHAQFKRQRAQEIAKVWAHYWLAREKTGSTTPAPDETDPEFTEFTTHLAATFCEVLFNK